MENQNHPLSRTIRPMALLALSAILASCSSDSGTDPAASPKAVAFASRVASTSLASTSMPASMPSKAAPIQNPILFVTQVPTAGDLYASRMSTFANHLQTMASVPRGGDLMIRYADGSLRNLTKEAGFGVEGLQDARAIAVREPTVHWDGAKAIFSMLVGGPAARYDHPTSTWQLYEVTGLARGQTAVITKVPGQPTGYNNVSPLYSSDDRILFTSDRPRGGEAHLFPQMDEYESVATITGIYSLDPATGQSRILNHTPSGAFSPSIDSYGRLIFTRWDHLQRDQQADAGTFNATNFASEAAGAANVGLQPEVFPESRVGMNSNYGAVNGFSYNLFTPWQMNQDGTAELTLNHIGRQELSFGYLTKSFASDSALSEYSNTSLIANKKRIRNATGLFHVREDPRNPGLYYAINTREFGTMTSNQIVRLTGAPGLNPEQMTIVDASPPEVDERLAGGRFRDPLPTSAGQMVAAYTASPVAEAGIALRLHQLDTDGNGQFVAGTALTPGIYKTISWWSPDSMREFSGALWEIEPAEVVARRRPPNPTSVLEAPEKSVLARELVDEPALRNWLKTNNLALIVTRNQTSRDRDDRQQPFNLQVPSGVKTTSGSGRVYDIAHYQILQADLVRAYPSSDSRRSKGRRVIAQPMTVSTNPANASGPAGSVKIAADGSTAAFVPANRALTWQTTDGSGTPIVRERVWVTLQPGEIRTCTGCHGENSANQAGLPAAVNEPEALRQLLRHWKQSNVAVRVNGSAPRVPARPTGSQTVASGAQPAQLAQPGGSIRARPIGEGRR